MLHSLTNRATIFLHPEYIAAVKHSGLINKRLINKEIVVLGKSGSITSVLEKLNDLLKKPEWRACRTQIVLSPHFTKFRIARWSEVLSKEEQRALILHQLEEIYGIEDGSFHVLLSDNGFRKNSLAFAVKTNFYHSLLDLEKRNLIKLDSITPYFALMTNYWHKVISKNAMIVLIENGYLYFAKINNQSWELIKASPLKVTVEQEVELLLSRELMQFESGMQAEIYFYAERQLDFNISRLKSKYPNITVLARNNNKESNQLLFSNFLR